MPDSSITSSASTQLVSSASTAGTSTSLSSDDEALGVAKQFEALLVQTMLKNMRSASPSGGLLDSDQGDMYLEMFDQKIAEEISKTGAFGLQESIYRQLTGHSIADRTDRGLHPSQNNTRSPLVRFTSLAKSGFTATDQTPTDFISRLRATAAETARKLGTTAEAVIAIAALETGWGKRIALTDNGSSTHNLFGIKADKSWRGESKEVMTHEFRKGSLQPEAAAFRVYPTERESIRDFGRFLLDNPRYERALEVAAEPKQFIRELQNAGYATDPDYAEKVISTMKSVSDLMADQRTGPQ